MRLRTFTDFGLTALTTAGFLSLQVPLAHAEPAEVPAPAAEGATGEDSAATETAPEAGAEDAPAQAGASEGEGEAATEDGAPAGAGDEAATTEEATDAQAAGDDAAAAEEGAGQEAAEEAPAAEEAAAEEEAAEEEAADDAGDEAGDEAGDDALLSAEVDSDFDLDDDKPKRNGKVLLIAGGSAMAAGLILGGVAVPLTRCEIESETCFEGEQRVLFVASAVSLGALGAILMTAGGVSMARAKRADKKAQAMFAPMLTPTSAGFGAFGRF